MNADRTALFEAERDHLFEVAYRMLGSRAEAEDVLQEAFVRWSRTDADVASPAGFLTTVVTRLCLDQLKSARERRETYVGPWLPEPILARSAAALPSTEERVELAESLGIAFLVALERLTPLERAAFLLHDVFDYSFEEVARIVGSTDDACRKMATRAREHVRDSRPRAVVSRERQTELFEAFLAACASGDASTLANVLSHDVVLQSDGGGKTRAALKPVRGNDRVARFLLGVMKRAPAGSVPEVVEVNGAPGVVVRSGDDVHAVMTLSFEEDAIANVWIVVNPDKLRGAF